MFKKFFSKFRSIDKEPKLVKVEFKKKNCLIRKHYISKLKRDIELKKEEQFKEGLKRLKAVQQQALQNKRSLTGKPNHQKNYSAKCLDFILNSDQFLTEYKTDEMDKFYGKDGVDGFLKRKNEFIHKIKNSVKFHIPDEGHILDIELTGNATTTYAPYLPLIRLPYERIVLEFETIPINGVSYPCIMVCEQFEDQIQLECFSRVLVTMKGHFYSEDIWSIQTSQPTVIKGQWDDMVVNINGTSKMNEIKTEYEKSIVMEEHENIHILLRFLSALSCSNINIETEIKPDAKLNKARIKKGKVPLFEYKVLKIDPQSTVSDGSTLSGTHASPRTHLRRGHIRRLKNGTTVWVNGCVVGVNNKGIINKDYMVV